MKIAIIGGTGNLGYGLAVRFAAAGHAVIIGSRAAEKAEAAPVEANTLLGSHTVRGAANRAAAAEAELVVLSVPMAAQDATAAMISDAVSGKVVVDATVPLAEGAPTRVAMPPEGSAAERTQALLPAARVVAAFHHVGAKALTRLDKAIDTDVLLAGDDADAKAAVLGLIEALGTRGIDVGPLYQAQVLERITPMLIGLNIRYKKRHTGIHITGF